MADSARLLVETLALIAAPGFGAALALYGPGRAAIVTRLAAAFGLGYVVAGGCAFVLAAGHVFWSWTYFALWGFVTAALWAPVLLRGSLRRHWRALSTEWRVAWSHLVLGALVLAGIVAVHLGYLHVLSGSRAIYYLNGMQIANSHGVPRTTLEYGQSWPMATDKVFLDSFVAVTVLLAHNAAIGPGVLLIVALLGAALGLCATAWELGVRYLAVLLPVLLLSNTSLLGTSMSYDFTQYRAEDFGRAVAFCALALGVYAIRRRRWESAIAAGLVLAAGSASHLVPVVVVVIALAAFAVGRLLVTRGWPRRVTVLRQGAVIAVTAAAAGVAIRAFAGGSFGLGGATDPRAYQSMPFDPTRYLMKGQLEPFRSGTAWYVAPRNVFSHVIVAAGLHVSYLDMWLTVAAAAAAVVLLLVAVRSPLRLIGVVSLGLLGGMIGVGLLFSYHYRVYVEATFGFRRMTRYDVLWLLLLALGTGEALLRSLPWGHSLRRRASWRAAWPARLLVGRSSRGWLPALGAFALIAALSIWLIPGAAQPHWRALRNDARVRFMDWVRTSTPCDARFLIDRRTEGEFAAFSGRFALLEGMGPFLRTERLPYVVSLMRGADRFFHYPEHNRPYLRQHRIDYVVVPQDLDLGYRAPLHGADLPAIAAAPFLKLVYHANGASVFRVRDAPSTPVTSLLEGPYLHCMTAPIRW